MNVHYTVQMFEEAGLAGIIACCRGLGRFDPRPEQQDHVRRYVAATFDGTSGGFTGDSSAISNSRRRLRPIHYSARAGGRALLAGNVRGFAVTCIPVVDTVAAVSRCYAQVGRSPAATLPTGTNESEVEWQQSPAP